MAWAMTLTPDRARPAGVMAMSGFIPQVGGFELDDSRLAGLPVAISHGTLDPVIAVDFGRAARDRAEAAGAGVEYHETPVGHTLDPDVVREQIDWLAGLP
jgi:phospholipase/carboxylesterase